jgi:hypothetical protein
MNLKPVPSRWADICTLQLAEAFADGAELRINFYEQELMRGPNKYMTPDSVADRVRRAGIKHPATAYLAAGNTLGAVIALAATKHVTDKHVEAHKRWLAEYRTPEEMA